MAYFIRILGTNDPDIPIKQLNQCLALDNLSAKFNYDDNENPNCWTNLHVLTESGVSLILIERYTVGKSDSGDEDIAEIKESIKGSKPSSAAKWLTKYLDKVEVIYSFQLLSASLEESNFKIIGSIRTCIWRKIGGILHADNEGFSNEEGFHILWEFSDNVTGDWNCAVRNIFGQWKRFTIDLGDKTQREEFKNGKVPKRAKLL